MKAVNGTCEKWTCRSSREAIIQTDCCLFVLLLFFAQRRIFFAIFLYTVIRKFRCRDTWSMTKKRIINNRHFLKSSPKAIVYCCQYFVNDLTMMRRFLQLPTVASFCWKVGGAALTQLNFLLCYVVMFIQVPNGQVTVAPNFIKICFICVYLTTYIKRLETRIKFIHIKSVFEKVTELHCSIHISTFVGITRFTFILLLKCMF